MNQLIIGSVNARTYGCMDGWCREITRDGCKRMERCGRQQDGLKGKGKGRVLAIALLTRELVTRRALQSRKWQQLIGMS